MPINEYSGELLAESPVAVAEVMLSRALAALEDCPSSEPIVESYVVMGDLVWDECCGILAAVPTRVYNTATFPTQATDVTNCGTTLLAVDVVVILLRCTPVIDAAGGLPSTQEIADSFAAISADAAVIYNALMAEMPPGWERANVEQTYMADGGCAVIDTRMTIGLPQSECCAC